MDEQATPCQLYLIIPSELDQGGIADFAGIGSSGNIASALLRCNATGEINREIAQKLLPLIQASGVPLLFENDASAASELGADGVHILANEEKYTECRRILGDDAIIGVECGLERHDGLTFGEMGADYIAFTQTSKQPPGWNTMELEELINWWSQTVTVPSIAWDLSGADDARRYASAGADFIAMEEPVWSHPKGPIAAVAEYNAILRDQKASA